VSADTIPHAALIQGGTEAVFGPHSLANIPSLFSLAECSVSQCISIENAAELMHVAEQVDAMHLARACGQFLC